MNWKRPPLSQFGLATFLAFTSACGVLFAIAVRLGPMTAFLAIGMPILGRVLIEAGIRAGTRDDSDLLIISGSLILGFWCVIALPVWMYIIVSFAAVQT